MDTAPPAAGPAAAAGSRGVQWAGPSGSTAAQSTDMGHLAARHPGIVMLSDIRAGMCVITLSDSQEVDVVERQGSRSS